MKQIFQDLFTQLGSVDNGEQLDKLYANTLQKYHAGDLTLKEMNVVNHTIICYADIMGWI